MDDMNNKTLFLIGNGIGMEHDSNAFSLASAMNDAWSEFSVGNRAKIWDLLNEPDEKPLQSEHDLHSLQIILWHIQKNFPEKHKDLISETRAYLFKIATHFSSVNSDAISSKHLITSLINYTNRNTPHVAIVTTNYDVLLYGSLFRKTGGVEHDIFDPFGGYEDYFNKYYNCYIALHGCSLFIRDLKDNEVYKESISSIQDRENQSIIKDIKSGNKDVELILTSENLKLQEIRNHRLLSKYWDKFGELLKLTDHLVCIGYGGNDPHINEEIENKRPKKISIIEHRFKKTYDKEIRKLFWQSKFNSKKVDLYSYDNILEQDISNILSATPPSE